jgi:hypothetical protein
MEEPGVSAADLYRFIIDNAEEVDGATPVKRIRPCSKASGFLVCP